MNAPPRIALTTEMTRGVEVGGKVPWSKMLRSRSRVMKGSSWGALHRTGRWLRRSGRGVVEGHRPGALWRGSVPWGRHFPGAPVPLMARVRCALDCCWPRRGAGSWLSATREPSAARILDRSGPVPLLAALRRSGWLTPTNHHSRVDRLARTPWRPPTILSENLLRKQGDRVFGHYAGGGPCLNGGRRIWRAPRA